MEQLGMCLQGWRCVFKLRSVCGELGAMAWGKQSALAALTASCTCLSEPFMPHAAQPPWGLSSPCSQHCSSDSSPTALYHPHSSLMGQWGSHLSVGTASPQLLWPKQGRTCTSSPHSTRGGPEQTLWWLKQGQTGGWRGRCPAGLCQLTPWASSLWLGLTAPHSLLQGHSGLEEVLEARGFVGDGSVARLELC